MAKWVVEIDDARSQLRMLECDDTRKAPEGRLRGSHGAGSRTHRLGSARREQEARLILIRGCRKRLGQMKGATQDEFQV